MKRILMIAATPFFSDRGCHIRIYNEIKYLKKEGIDITLCTYHLGNDIEGVNAKRIKNVSWYKKITPGPAWGKVYLDFLLLILSYKEFKKLKPKIIHAHLYESLCIAFAIKILTFSNTKIIFDCQGSLAEEMYAYSLKNKFFGKLLYHLFTVIEGWLLFLPNKILCSSENSRNFLMKVYSIQEDKIDILPDAADPELFRPYSHEEKMELRSAQGIPVDNTVIIYTGSMNAAKGVKELLDSIPQILESNPKMTFVFAGYGDLLEAYQDKYKRYIESKNVVFFGRFSYFDLPRYLALADYAIDPKKGSTESSGKLYNYLAAGLKVINDISQFPNSIDSKPVFWNEIIKYLMKEYSFVTTNFGNKAAIIIVNFNGLRLLEDCYDGLERQTNKNFDLYFVDNNSQDNSIGYTLERFPNTKIFRLNKNLGFAKPNNIALKAALNNLSTKYFICLNNDTKVEPDWLAEMIRGVETSGGKIGMAAPKSYFPNRLIQNAGIEIIKSQKGYFLEAVARGANVNDTNDPKYNFPELIFGPSGNSSLYTREMLETVGLFDEDFFAYVEDTDLAMRGQKAGFKCIYNPNAKLIHYHSQTSQGASPLKAYLSKRNLYFLAVKNFSFLEFLNFLKYDMFWNLNQVFGHNQTKSVQKLGSKIGIFGMIKIQMKCYFMVILLTPKMLTKRFHIRS